MLLPVISHNKIKGFLILEALIAMAIMILIIPAAVSLGFSSQNLQIEAGRELDEASSTVAIVSNGAVDQVVASSARYSHEFGKSTCTIGTVLGSTPNPDFSRVQLYINNPNTGINIGSNASGTDVIARNGFIYETVDSPTQSSPDFFIINTSNPAVPTLVSSLNTGPGLASIAVAGHYAYVANESSVSQLQVIDIATRTAPVLVQKLKLPLPQSTTTVTAPQATTISYGDNRVFLGTVKWLGDEFNAINVTNPSSPVYLGGFDTGTLVNSIYVNGLAYPTYAYIANADIDQMRVLDVSDPAQIVLMSGFSPTGSSVLEGKSLAVEGTSTMLYFGRSGGGYNVPSYHKLFAFDLSHDPLAASPTYSIDVPGGVYGIVVSSGYVFLTVGGGSGGEGNGGSVQIWKSDLSAMLYSIALPTLPASLSCDHDRLYVGLAGRDGFAIITFT